MNTEQALELIKQGLAALPTQDWNVRVKLVEAMHVVEQALVDLRLENERLKKDAPPIVSVE